MRVSAPLQDAHDALEKGEMKKARQLRLWGEKGRHFMEFDGEESDLVATSPSRKWYCGAFSSGLVILGNTSGRLLRFGSGCVLLLTVDDEGRAAILESGSNSSRVRVLWPDGFTSQPRVKNPAAVSGLRISSGVLECERDGECYGFVLSEMTRSQSRKAVLSTGKTRLRFLWPLLAVAAIYLWLKLR